MKIDKQSEVLTIYRAFQAKRSDTGTEKVNVQASLAESTLSANENQVMDVYRAFQKKRIEPDVQTGEMVMAAVRERIAYRNVRAHQAITEVTTQQPNWTQSLLQLVTHWIDSHRWSFAMATAMALVIVMVPLLLTRTPSIDPMIAGVLVNLQNNAEQTAQYIEPTAYQTLGFSGGTEPSNVAFQLGVSTIDLQIVAATGEQHRLQDISQNIIQLAKISQNASLIQASEALLPHSTDKKQIKSKIGDYINEVNLYFATAKNQSEIFELGKTLELTLLAYQVSKTDPATNQLLNLAKRETLAVKSKLLAVSGTENWLNQLESSPSLGEHSSLEESQIVFEKLIAIKAVLQ